MKLFSKVAYHSTRQKGMKEFNDVTDDSNAYKGEGAMVHGWGLYLQSDKELNTVNYLAKFTKYETRYETDDNSIDEYDKYKDYKFIYDITVNGKTLIGVNHDYETNCDYLDLITFDELKYYDEDGNLVYNKYNPRGQCLSILAECSMDKNRVYEVFDENIEALKAKDESVLGITTDEERNNAIKWCEDIKEAVKNIPDDFQYKNIKFNGNWKNKKKVSGAQYTVEIPDDWVFLYEDKLISDITNDDNRNTFELLAKSLWKVSSRNGITYDEFKEKMFGIDGRNFYKNIIAEMFGNSEQKASWWLSEHNIKGMEYDGGRDGHCYVIFDCEGLKITKEN